MVAARAGAASIRLLMVGTGRMAERHAQRFAEIDGVVLAAAVDVDALRLAEFCDTHGIARSYASVEAALAAESFHAVTIVTPDPSHAPVALRCLAAGLHVLCEKPLADSVEQAGRMATAAEQAGTVTMVNLDYRRSGALQEARRLVDDGRIGSIRHIEAAYRQSWLVSDYWGDWRTEPAWLWRLSSAHGSLGVLGDVGIHILDFVTAGSGLEVQALQCRLKVFDKAPGNRIGDYQLDANDSCVISAELDNGALMSLSMSRFASGHQNTLELVLYGTKGALRVVHDSDGDRLEGSLDADLDAQRWSPVNTRMQPDSYARFAAAVRQDQSVQPDFAHAARLQQLLALCWNSHDSGRWMSVENQSPQTR